MTPVPPRVAPLLTVTTVLLSEPVGIGATEG